MIRSSMIALALAAAAASCASTSSDTARADLTQSTTTTRSTTTTTPSPPPSSGASTTTTQSSTATTTAPAGEYTDAQLRGFIAASAAINPIISASGGQLTPEQITQVRAALTANNLDSDTYNAIAARMRSDTAFAARVQALNTASPSGSSADPSTPTTPNGQ